MAAATVTQMFSDEASSAFKRGSVIRPLKVNVRPAPERNETSSGPINDAGPLTPAAALQRYNRVLSDYEKKEIFAYPQIWYVGATANKIRAPAKDTTDASSKASNYGYDNDKARYKVVKHDHIAYRFEVLGALGNGSFGDVVRVFDHKKKRQVALKIIRNEKRFHDQGAVEVKLLEHLRQKDKNNKHNVVHMHEHFVFRSHLCIAFEMMAHDLYSELKKGNFKGFPIERVRESAADLVQCLRNLRRSRIVHCDLKPENVLVREAGKPGLKDIDFGSSCFVSERVHTYIQSRFYRAPEIVLGSEYGTPIDMWSLGCLLVELVTGKPLFPAASEKELIAMQVEMLGMPEQDIIVSGTRSHHYFTSNYKLRPVVDRKGRSRGVAQRDLPSAIMTEDNRLLRDFVLQCLKWDPAQRITPRDASRHPFITGFNVEPKALSPVVPPARRASAPHSPSLRNATYTAHRVKRDATSSQAGDNVLSSTNKSTNSHTSTASGGDVRTPMRHQSQVFKVARRASLGAARHGARGDGHSGQFPTMPIDVGRSLKVIFDQYS